MCTPEIEGLVSLETSTPLSLTIYPLPCNRSMHRYVRPGTEGLPVPLDANAREEAREEDKAG